MSSSILDNVVASITPQIVSALSARLNETEGAVRQGLTGAVSALLGNIANHGGDSNFWSQLLSLASNPSNSGGPSSLAALALGTPNTSLMDLGNSLLSLVFGPQKAEVAGAIAHNTGLTAASAGSVLGLAAPLVLGWLNQQIHDQHMNAASLAGFLSSDAPALEAAVPASIQGLFAARLPSPLVASKGILPLWPILGVVFLAGLMWYLLHYSPAAAPVVEAPKIVAAAPVDPALAKLGAFSMKKLPTGIDLNIPEFGIENNLLKFIEDKTKPVDKTTWFDFDRLLFDTGKATLQPASQEQLQNIANILKAFPGVKVKIGGYTDNVGDKAFNMKLSSERATNVMQELVGMGIAKDRLAAEGYGEDHPVADNSTEAGRAQNRRISLRVTEK
jgi:OmpA-OmpF porin, OOP family